MRMIAICAAAGLVFGCATPEAEQDEAVNLDDDVRVGERVDNLCFRRTISGFSRYDGDADGIVLRRNLDDEFLAVVAGVCPPIDRAQRIGLTPQLGATGCLRPGDRIWVSDTIVGRGPTPLSTTSCVVRDIFLFDRDAELSE